MANLPPKPFNVTNLVGITKDKEPNVLSLISALKRTVSPDSWFAMGGHGAIEPFFNEAKQAWFICVFTEDQQVLDTIGSLITALGG